MYIVTISNGNLGTCIHGDKERLTDGRIVKGINTIDTFTFSMLPSNAGFHLVNEFTTRVTVYNTAKDRYDFIGRVLYPETSMGDDGLITKEVTCESIAGYLCDSQQEYVETKNWTVKGLLKHLIDCHNSQVEEYKQFTIGEVTATDTNDNLYLGIQRENTWDSIADKLIKQIGGELRFRVIDGVNYIDYLEKVGEEKETEIALSVNMKSITREQNPTAYITRLYPYGCKLTKEVRTTDADGNVTTETVETEERLDISSEAGKKYIDDEAAIAVYGIHSGTVIWDDVTTAGILHTKAKAWLEANNKVQIKYSITALDLSIIGLAIDDFDVGNYHPIKNALLGIDDTARIIKKQINICEEYESTIEVGDNFKTLSDIQREQAAALKKAQNQLDRTVTDLTNKINKVVTALDERVTKIEGIDGLYFYIKYSQYADGHAMTDAPNDSTEYMGTCSTNSETAPTNYTEYTWCKIRGEDGTDGTPGKDGVDGKTQYLHIKYSDDGKTFTANNGETLGAWIGTLVDFNEADSTKFSDYTWKKFTEDVEEELEQIREEFHTEIQQLSDSIKLEVSGSLGSNASIILSAGDNEYTGDLDLSQVRKAFANDPTAISISAGIITFNSNTIVINSTNFSVTSEGVVTATSGTIGAITLSETGIFSYNSGYNGSHAGWYRPASITTDTTCFFAGATAADGTNANFYVTYGGALYAEGATIDGTIITTTTTGGVVYKSKFTSGGIDFYYNDIHCGRITSKYYPNTTNYGISLQVDYGEYIMFGGMVEVDVSGSAGDMRAYQVDYVLNYGWSSNYKEKHIFQTSARFLGNTYFHNAFFRGAYFYENAYLKSCESDGTAAEEMIGWDGSRIDVGSVGCPTMLRGTTVYLKNTSTTVTSDRNAKNSIEALPDEYEAFFDGLQPVRFKYNEGRSGRYHVGYVAQDVEQALTDAGLTSMDFAGFVDVETADELGLAYDEFIAVLTHKIKRLENRIRVLESQ